MYASTCIVIEEYAYIYKKLFIQVDLKFHVCHSFLYFQDEEQLNMQRVTWLLPHRDVLWVGSGDGNLIIYEVVSLPLKNKLGTDTDADRSSDNDISTSFKGKPMATSSNWSSIENQSQDSQSISEVTDDILEEVHMGLKDFQHSLSPIRGSPDGQASNHPLTCSSEFKKELKDGGLTICTDELSPLNEVYSQNQLKKLIDDPAVLTKGVYTTQDVSCFVVGGKSQASLADKNSASDYHSTNSVRDEKSDSLCENAKLNAACFNEEQRSKNFPIETFKNSINDSTHKKYPFSKDEQMDIDFTDPIHPSNVLDEKGQEIMNIPGFDVDSSLDEYYNSKNIAPISQTESLPSEDSMSQTKVRNTQQRPLLQRLNSDSIVGKSNMELNTGICQPNMNLKDIPSSSLSATDVNHSNIPYFPAFHHENMSLEPGDQWTKIENKNNNLENSFDDTTLTRVTSMKSDNEEESSIITDTNTGPLFKDVHHDNYCNLTEHEIKKPRDARRQLKKSYSTGSPDSAKYVYQGIKHSCKLAEVYHPRRQSISRVAPVPEFKLNKEDNPAIERLNSLDQKYVELKNQESFLNSEAYKKLDENAKREKILQRKQSLRSSIAVDSGKSLEKYFADHEAKYRLEFSNYQVGLSLPLTSESSESDTNTTEKTSIGSDIVNMDESNVPSIDLESLDGYYNQKLDNFLEANSNFSQRSSVEIVDICDLNLIAKIKISDRPVGCLLETM